MNMQSSMDRISICNINKHHHKTNILWYGEDIIMEVYLLFFNLHIVWRYEHILVQVW